MIRATVSKLERHLAPPSDGIARELVACIETPEGFRCDCGAVHASAADAERAHAHATLILESIVESDAKSLSGTSPG